MGGQRRRPAAEELRCVPVPRGTAAPVADKNTSAGATSQRKHGGLGDRPRPLRKTRTAPRRPPPPCLACLEISNEFQSECKRNPSWKNKEPSASSLAPSAREIQIKQNHGTRRQHVIVEDFFKPTTSIMPAINIWLNAGTHIPGIIYCSSSLQGPFLSLFFFNSFPNRR